MELRDRGVADDVFHVLERYSREPPIRSPDDLPWRNDPTAQWSSQTKNCKDLAMSIAQLISETIFPEYMSGRSQWKGSPHDAETGSGASSETEEEPLGSWGLRNPEGYCWTGSEKWT